MQREGAVSSGPHRDAVRPAAGPGKVQCPSCGTSLVVPPGVTIRVAKCSQCKHKFELPAAPAVVSDAEVAGWMAPPEDDEPAFRPARHVPHAEDRHSTHQTLIADALNEGIRLVSCDSAGALLEFSAERLKEPAFRAAMPRVCMQCGARSHLEAHVVIYGGILAESTSLEAQRPAGSLRLRAEEAKDLSIEEVMKRLSRVPGATPPADLPMPYWLCDMCSTSKSVAGQAEINSATGEGRCRLLIRNLRRAEEFLCAIGARGTHTHHELVRHAAKVVENPWDALSLVVQHRLQQWFRPTTDEHFLAYVPDRDHARTEDGAFGLAISSRRFVCHLPLRHWESEADRPLELVLSAGKTKGDLIVTVPAHKSAVKVDADGIAKLRRALTLGKYQVQWR